MLEEVQDLLHDILNGAVTGVAFVALHKGTGYSANVLGSVHQHPLFTLGVCRALEEAIAVQTRKKT